MVMFVYTLFIIFFFFLLLYSLFFLFYFFFFFFFQAEDGIRDAQESRGLGDVYKRQVCALEEVRDRRLIWLLNPWGSGAPREAEEGSSQGDGRFALEFDTFCRLFDVVHICARDESRDQLTLEANILPAPTNWSDLTNQFRLTDTWLGTPGGRVTLTLAQHERRLSGLKNEYVPISLDVFVLPKEHSELGPVESAPAGAQTFFLPFIPSREVSLLLDIPIGGTALVLPRAYDNTRDVPFRLTVRFDETVSGFTLAPPSVQQE
eukprot:TRINITY_DN7506_c0_g1_i1.p1 TRINITY_DN7506_c0_g1~~TRINITY_DN7506_c0_g1_i1.p1  ORF type:complete len:262 (-),score=66.09 TRINITY_DN7506_c0_g1_i1:300-1085(-)